MVTLLGGVSCSKFSTDPLDLSGGDGSFIVVMRDVSVKAKVESHYGAELSALSDETQRVAKMQAVQELTREVAMDYELNDPARVFSVAIQGGVYRMSEDEARELLNDPRVAYVEPNRRVQASVMQSGVTWGLDRLDQSNLPLDSRYRYEQIGAAVNAYVIDTGILTTHQEFQGRAVHGFDAVDDDSDATDCNGHGTHVAGTIGSASYGVSKNVKLHAVRVLDCAGSGSYADVVAGIEWVASHHVSPAVANMSLGGPPSQSIDDAVRAAIQAGVTFAVAAGNENQDACQSSPARVSTAITVGSTTNADARSSFSNYGSCVSIFAPGSDIKSTWYTSTLATNTISGTSMASPHVAGVAALYLAAHPTARPSQVKAAILAGSLSGKVSSVGTASPNRLLNTVFLFNGESPQPPPPPAPVPIVQVLSNGVATVPLVGGAGDEKVFSIAVPVGSTDLVIATSGGTGDVDLYVKRGARPAVTEYDCRPYTSGNTESCTVAQPVADTWYIMLRGYQNYSGVTLKASYKSPVIQPGAPCVACEFESGILSSRGASAIVPKAGSYRSPSGEQRLWLKGPAGGDFDLYLFKRNGSTWTQVASAMGLGSDEQISYQGEAGEYQIKVTAYSGTGKFEVWRKLP